MMAPVIWDLWEPPVRIQPCEFLPFASDELVIATPATPYYQAFTKQKEPLDDLLKEPFLLREDNSGTKQETLHFLKNRGLTLDDLNVIAIMDDAGSLKKCIKLGMGISILSRATVFLMLNRVNY